MQALSTAQVQAIESADLDAMSASTIQQFSNSQIAALTQSQLVGLHSTDIQDFSASQIAALTVTQLSYLSSNDITAMSGEQVSALSNTQIASLSVSQIHGMESADIAGMSASQVSAFTATQTNAMTAGQLDAKASTPIVLDLDGNGISTTAAADGVNFDLDASGKTHKVGWVAGNDGLLVRDINHDGVINDGKELFGSATKLSNGQTASDGYQALADLDSNHDGKVDANHDGKTDVAELHGLVDMGVTSLSLNYSHTSTVDHGNAVALTSSFTMADGKTHDMADVWFAKAATPAPKLDELLAAAPTDLVPASTTASTATDSTATAHEATATVQTAAVKTTSLDEELLKAQQGLI